MLSQVTSGTTVSLPFTKSFIVCYQHKVLTYHKVNFLESDILEVEVLIKHYVFKNYQYGWRLMENERFLTSRY